MSDSMLEYCINCNFSIDTCNCGDTETCSDEAAICPYCGCSNEACDSDGLLYDEATSQYDCSQCGKTFAVSVSVQWTICCKPVKENQKHG